jgi:hypothetical protein
MTALRGPQRVKELCRAHAAIPLERKSKCKPRRTVALCRYGGAHWTGSLSCPESVDVSLWRTGVIRAT